VRHDENIEKLFMTPIGPSVQGAPKT